MQNSLYLWIWMNRLLSKTKESSIHTCLGFYYNREMDGKFQLIRVGMNGVATTTQQVGKSSVLAVSTDLVSPSRPRKCRIRECIFGSGFESGVGSGRVLGAFNSPNVAMSPGNRRVSTMHFAARLRCLRNMLLVTLPVTNFWFTYFKNVVVL